MHPILFELPWGFPIRLFGVMLAIGFLLASAIFTRLALRGAAHREEVKARYGAVPVWVLFGVVAGARLLYVVVEVARQSDTGHQYLSRPWTILTVWEGGLVMYGGLFGGLMAGILCCRRYRIPVGHAADLGLTAGFFGQAIGRIGCLLVGDDYGSVVPERWRHLPFPITLRVPEELKPGSLFGDENSGQILWATQPWMSAKALLVALLGLWLLRRRRYPGQAALWMLFTYSVLRYGIELFRGDAVRGVWFGGALSTSQILSVATAAVATALLARNRSRREAVPLPEARA